jgi:CheY-like chemotaxis protein
MTLRCFAWRLIDLRAATNHVAWLCIASLNMALIELFHDSFIVISHDPESSYLYVDWIGYQSVDTAHMGCEAILDLMVRTKVDSVLNDNSHVLGAWGAAAKWVARDWFPRMKQFGLRRFAWVQSPSQPSQLSTNATVSLLNADAFGVKIFHNKAEAMAWLNQEHSEPAGVLEHRRRILVIDDNDDFSDIFHTMLHTMGCNPETARTANDGLEMAHKNIPDMIFCDIGLPGDMDGYEFAHAVRADKLLWNIPLIAVSGFETDAHMASAREAGYDRVYRKPLKFNDISEALASFSQGRPQDRRIHTRAKGHGLSRRHYDRG